MDSVQFARVLVWLNHFVIATELVTTRAMPDRDVFYVAHPIRSIVSSAAPAALDRYLAALPAMSLIPFAPFFGNTVIRPTCRTRRQSSSLHKQNSSARNGRRDTANQGGISV